MLLWQGYDVMAGQVEHLRRSLTALAQGHEPIRRFQELPSFGWVRAATFCVCMDTPWRFRSKSCLWKYLGIGLERHHSGEGPVHLRVPRRANKRLKNVMLGAAWSAILQADNPFADQYTRWIQEGLSCRNGRRNVARGQAATLWGMWKSGDEYRPEWVGRARVSVLQSG